MYFNKTAAYSRTASHMFRNTTRNIFSKSYHSSAKKMGARASLAQPSSGSRGKTATMDPSGKAFSAMRVFDTAGMSRGSLISCERQALNQSFAIGMFVE